MKDFIVALVAVSILLIGAVSWSKSIQSKDPEIISRNGLHWHPELVILVKGEKQAIPANIGIGAQYASYPGFDRQMGMTAIHTHEDADRGIIHFEFGGVVRKEDLTLGRFLAVWDKNINSFGSNVKMTVNGAENLEFDKYVMRDGDRIELSYE